MIRTFLLLAALLLPLPATATDVPLQSPGADAIDSAAAEPGTGIDADAPSPAGAHGGIDPIAAPPGQPALPPMRFFSSVVADDLLEALRAHPQLAGLDKDLTGSPLNLVVTHTMRPTAGGTAAGLISAILAGSTLGIIPVVSNDRLVLRYQVQLNGREIALYEFENTTTRAENLWTAGNAEHGGLGKSALEWAMSTADEVANRLAQDPAVLAVRDEVAFYYPDALEPAPAGNADEG